MTAHPQLIDEYAQYRKRKEYAYRQVDSLDLYLMSVGQPAQSDDAPPAQAACNRTDAEIYDKICEVLCNHLKINSSDLRKGGHVKITSYGSFNAAEVRYLLVALIKTCKNIEVDFNVLKERFQLKTGLSYSMLRADDILTTQKSAKALFSQCIFDLKCFGIYFSKFTPFPVERSKKSRFLEN